MTLLRDRPSTAGNVDIRRRARVSDTRATHKHSRRANFCPSCSWTYPTQGGTRGRSFMIIAGLRAATPEGGCMHSACMVAVQIRNVPDPVRVVLSEQAARRGQSLQAYLLDVLTEHAARAATVSILARFDGRTDGATT